MSVEEVSKLSSLGIGVVDDSQVWSRMPVHILEREIMRCLPASYPVVIKLSQVCKRWRLLLHQAYYSRILSFSSVADPAGQGWFLQLFVVGQTTELFAALHHPKLDVWQQLPMDRSLSDSLLMVRLDFVKADKGLLLLKKSFVDSGDRGKVEEEEWVVIKGPRRLDNRQVLDKVPTPDGYPSRVPDMGWNISEANIFFTVSRDDAATSYKIIILAVDKDVNWFVSQVYDSTTKVWQVVKMARLDERTSQSSLIWSLFCGVCCHGVLYLLIFPPDSYDQYFVVAYDIHSNGAVDIPVPTDEMPLQNGTLRMSFCHLVECGGRILLLLDYINGSNDPFERWHDAEGIGIWELTTDPVSGARDHWVKHDSVTREQIKAMECHRDFLRNATFLGVGGHIYVYCWNHTINQTRSILVYHLGNKSWKWLSRLPNLGFQSQISFCHSAVHL